MVLYSKINLLSLIRFSFLVSLVCIISISSVPLSCKSYVCTLGVNHAISESNPLSLGQDSDFDLLWQNSLTRLNLEWVKNLGGDRLEYGDDFVQNSEGNVYVTSTSFTPVYATGNVDITLFEVEASTGNAIWYKKWDRAEFDYVSGIAEGHDGRVYLAGTTSNMRRARNYSHNYMLVRNFDLFLLSFDPVEKQWLKSWSWGESNVNEYCNDVTIGNDGHIYLVGTSQSRNNDIIVVKLDETVNEPIWIQAYGGEEAEEGNTLIYGKDGFLYALGTRHLSLVSSQFYILKIDTESGESLWDMSWGSMSTNEGLSLFWGENNSLYITGTTNDQNEDLIINKLDLNSGEIIWTAVWGTTNRDYGSDLVLFNQNLLVLGTANETGSKGGDVVLLELNPQNGDILYFSLWGSPHQEMGKKLLTDELDDGFYLLGTIETSSETNYNSDILIGYFTQSSSESNVSEGVFRIGFSVTIIGLSLLLVIRNKSKNIKRK